MDNAAWTTPGTSRGRTGVDGAALSPIPRGVHRRPRGRGGYPHGSPRCGQRFPAQNRGSGDHCLDHPARVSASGVAGLSAAPDKNDGGRERTTAPPDGGAERPVCATLSPLSSGYCRGGAAGAGRFRQRRSSSPPGHRAASAQPGGACVVAPGRAPTCQKELDAAPSARREMAGRVLGRATPPVVWVGRGGRARRRPGPPRPRLNSACRGARTSSACSSRRPAG